MWECYTLIYEAKAPIHIGVRTLGIVNRTRYYILGRNFWGATTAMLARRIMKNYDSKIYEKAGEFVRKNIIFTHFYLYDNQNDILCPQYEERLKYGSLSEGQFESRFISSYVSTALEKSFKSAEDESLHEIEFIKPHYKRDGEIESTKFFGHIFINENPEFPENIKEELENELEKYASWEKLRELASELWVGGERNYGMGRIQLLRESEEKNNPTLFKKYEIDLNNLRIKFNNKSILALSHVEFDSRFTSIKGDIEPLLGREWEQNKMGTGHKISEAGIYLTPGTEFEKEKDIEMKIDDFGVWRIIQG